MKTGPTKPENKAVTDSLFKGHMANIVRLEKEGKLIVAGPLQKNEQSYRGIFILNVADVVEAKKLLDSDPAVHAGLLDAEVYGWYGSAALPVFKNQMDYVSKYRMVLDYFDAHAIGLTATPACTAGSVSSSFLASATSATFSINIPR